MAHKSERQEEQRGGGERRITQRTFVGDDRREPAPNPH